MNYTIPIPYVLTREDKRYITTFLLDPKYGLTPVLAPNYHKYWTNDTIHISTIEPKLLLFQLQFKDSWIYSVTHMMFICDESVKDKVLTAVREVMTHFIQRKFTTAVLDPNLK